MNVFVVKDDENNLILGVAENMYRATHLAHGFLGETVEAETDIICALEAMEIDDIVTVTSNDSFPTTVSIIRQPLLV